MFRSKSNVLRSLKVLLVSGILMLAMSTAGFATPTNFTIGSVTFTPTGCLDIIGNGCSSVGAILQLAPITPLNFSLSVGQSTTIDVLNYAIIGKGNPNQFQYDGYLSFDLTTPNGTTAVIMLTAIRFDGGCISRCSSTNPNLGFDSVQITFGPSDNSYWGSLSNPGILNVDLIDPAVLDNNHVGNTPRPPGTPPGSGDIVTATAQGTFTFVKDVPEPNSLLLMGSGLLAAAFGFRSRLKSRL